MTPRKPRQRQNQPQASTSQLQPRPHHLNQVQGSDIESEAVYIQPIPARTNTELNLSVLQRYHTSITTILAISASAQVYTFARAEQAWDRANIEGTLFICLLAPAVEGGPERYCIVVLNRKGLDNLIMEMTEFQDVEIQGEILILVVKATASEERKDLGLFIAAEGTVQLEARDINCRLIKELWERTEGVAVREDEGMISADETVTGGVHHGMGLGTVARGRRLSLSELFRQQSSGLERLR